MGLYHYPTHIQQYQPVFNNTYGVYNACDVYHQSSDPTCSVANAPFACKSLVFTGHQWVSISLSYTHTKYQLVFNNTYGVYNACDVYHQSSDPTCSVANAPFACKSLVFTGHQWVSISLSYTHTKVYRNTWGFWNFRDVYQQPSDPTCTVANGPFVCESGIRWAFSGQLRASISLSYTVTRDQLASDYALT